MDAFWKALSHTTHVENELSRWTCIFLSCCYQTWNGFIKGSSLQIWYNKLKLSSDAWTFFCLTNFEWTGLVLIEPRTNRTFDNSRTDEPLLKIVWLFLAKIPFLIIFRQNSQTLGYFPPKLQIFWLFFVVIYYTHIRKVQNGSLRVREPLNLLLTNFEPIKP